MMEHQDMPPILSYPENAETAADKPLPEKAPPRVALAAAALALLGSALLYPSIASVFTYGPSCFGINITLCVAALYAAYFVLMKGQRQPDLKRGWPLFLAILPISCAPALFSVPELTAVNLLFLIVAVPLHLSLMSGGNWPQLTGGALFAQAASDIAGRPFAHIADASRATMLGSGKGMLRNALLILAGLVITVPILAVVVTLLCASDQRFYDLVFSLGVDLDVAQIATIGFVALVTVFPLLSVLYSLPLAKDVTWTRPSPTGKGIHPVPVYALLVCFNAVLALFAVMQLGSLFSPPPSVATDLAQQAHQGFFPMFAAAVICYAVQAICLRFTRRQGRALPLRILITAMAGSLLIMMASAMRAILVYQGAFGLSRLRVYVTFFIAALFLLLIFTLLRVWSKATVRALSCAVLCLALIGVNYMNLDRSIATYNIDLAERTGTSVDAGYLLTLSADALSVCAEHAELFGGTHEAFELSSELEARLRENREQTDDLRVWNLGRAKAKDR